MTFQIEITPIAEAQIEQAYHWYRDHNSEFADRWFRGLMNAIASSILTRLNTTAPLAKKQ